MQLENLEITEFMGKFNIKTNYSEIWICSKIISFTEYKEVPNVASKVHPEISFLNLMLSKQNKGVSLLYKELIGRRQHIIDGICHKWNESESTSIDIIGTSISLIMHNRKDVLLLYELFYSGYVHEILCLLF